MSTTISQANGTSAPTGDSLPRIPGYEVVRLLGRGGMGCVYLAKDARLGREVAIKTLFAGADGDVVERFRSEVTAVAAIRHPNVLPVHHAGEVDGRPYFVMEYVAGGTLAHALDGKPIAPRDAAGLLEPVARAIQHCHEHGILHRDLKPGNILLSDDLRHMTKDQTQTGSTLVIGDSPFHPWVADFGLAKRLDASAGLTRTGDILGTPAYMAPEQASGVVSQLGPGVDVYALGAILYEALTGRPPFQSPDPLNTLMMVLSMDPIPPRQLQPRLPRDIETICLKCLEKLPRKRYLSAADLADDLRRFLDGRPIVARPTRVWERVAKWAKRRPAWAALAVVSVLAVAALAVGAILIERKNVELKQSNTELTISREETAKQLLIALESVHRMLLRLADDLADVPQAGAARRKTLEDAESLCRAIIRNNTSDPGGREYVALAQLRLGEVCALQGRTAEAAEAYHHARDGYSGLVAESPDSPVYHAQLLAVHNQLGLLHDKQNETDDALAEYRAALTEGESVTGDPEVVRLVSRVRNNLAQLLARTGDTDKAEAEHRRNLAERLRTFELTPDDREAVTDLAATRANLANVLMRREQWGPALDELLAAEKLYAALKQPRPADRASLGRVRMNMGLAANKQKRAELEERATKEAVATLAPLAAEFPVPEYRSLASYARLRLAYWFGQRNQGEKADEQLRGARELLVGLVKEFPQQTDYQGQLDLCRQLLGELPGNKKP